VNLELVTASLWRMAAGVPITLQLVGTSMACGIALATLVALASLSRNRWLSRVARGYVYVIRGTPLLLQVFFIYYGVGQLEWIRDSPLWSLFRSAYWCAITALVLSTTAYGSEIIRGGLLAIPRGQLEAATAFSMTPWQRFRHVTLPLAIRQMVPAYGNELILMLKATSVASTVTIMEVTGIARTMAAETYAPIEIFLTAGVLYLSMNASLAGLVHILEAGLRGRGGLHA
jgi:His/Glu/Gln/Arg/opine family amino acid ABC transporter permease subunit